MPQLLNDIAYSLLTATTAYLEFREFVSWKGTNYLWESKEADHRETMAGSEEPLL
jgi:hypothetical protein